MKSISNLSFVTDFAHMIDVTKSLIIGIEHIDQHVEFEWEIFLYQCGRNHQKKFCLRPQYGHFPWELIDRWTLNIGGQNVCLANPVLEKSSIIIVDWEEKLRKLNLNFPVNHIIWIFENFNKVNPVCHLIYSLKQVKDEKFSKIERSTLMCVNQWLNDTLLCGSPYSLLIFI